MTLCPCDEMTINFSEHTLEKQDFYHFVGSDVGDVPLEVAGHGEDSVAHAYLGHAVRAAGRGGNFLAGDVDYIGSFLRKTPLSILGGTWLMF